ncbi:MAG: Trk system potassium transporter TrkA [Bacteroidota bacterium]
MKIVIAGAGDVGFHLAELLSHENQDITLIDTDQEVLDHAATHLDVLTLRGDSSSMEVLKEAKAQKAGLVLAVTTSEKNNILTAMLAKRMGASKTIARVKSDEYLNTEQEKTLNDLGVDTLISPQKLASDEIKRLVRQCSFTDVFEFDNGKINLVGFQIYGNSPLLNENVEQIEHRYDDMQIKLVAILRGNETILPSPTTYLRRNDHIYFVTRKEHIDFLAGIVEKRKTSVRNIMILGGSDLSLATAQCLEGNYNITLIEKDKDRCKQLTEHLSHTLVINGNTSNIDLLEEEGLSNMDAFIALTENFETNIIASLAAKNHGVYKTIAQVEHKEYIHLSQNLGVDTLINKKLIAANNIFRYIRKGQIEAITSLSGVDAEVIEFVVNKENYLTKKPLKDLHIPKAALVAGIVRNHKGIIPDKDFQLQLNDKVIVFCMPEAISKLEKLFR